MCQSGFFPWVAEGLEDFDRDKDSYIDLLELATYKVISDMCILVHIHIHPEQTTARQNPGPEADGRARLPADWRP